MNKRITFGLTILLSVVTQAVMIVVLSVGVKGFAINTSISTIYALGILLGLITAYFVVLKLFKKLDVFNRLPIDVPSKNLLLIGGLLVLIPSIMQVFSLTIPGGGVAFATSQITSPFRTIGYVFLLVGTAKLLLAMKPHASYKYKTSNTENV